MHDPGACLEARRSAHTYIHVNRYALQQDRSDITLESSLLLAGLVVILSIVSTLVFGLEGLLFGPIAFATFWLFEARAPVDWMLKAHRARPIPRHHPLSRILENLRHRAGIEQDVQLFYSPTPHFNAYTIGHREKSAIVLNAPIIDRFTEREVAGILAHELSHVVNNDIRFMAMAAALGTMISQMSFILLVVGLVTLPFAFMQGAVGQYFLMIAAALITPTIALFLQARLSQAREFAADLGATELLGTPHYLISALMKLERYSGAFLLPWIRRGQDYFGSHPNTLERIRRLKSYSGPQSVWY